MRDERNMSETCTYSGRDDLLVAYLYDDIESDDRVTFNAHLALASRAATRSSACSRDRFQRSLDCAMDRRYLWQP